MKNRNDMKKTILIFLSALALFACEKYEDYQDNTVGFTTVYFPTQELTRSAISGEGMQIKIGAYLGGVRTNEEDRIVNFEIDESLLNGNYELLPASYYELSNDNEITISAGNLLGMVDVKFDSLKFATDSSCWDAHYAIPLRITSASTDSILDGKEFAVFPIKMMNTFEGTFYEVGQVKKFLTVKHVLDDAYLIGDTLDYTKSPNIRLTTVGMNAVVVNGIAGYGDYKMILQVNPDNTVDVEPFPEMAVQVVPNGENTWDPVRRIFHLNYKFNYQERDYEISEAYIFQSRIRDGISEWRWAGFPGN